MRAHFEHGFYLVRHKWFVLVAGRALGVPLWRLLVHDWSKFTFAEWTPYVRKYHASWGHAESLDHAQRIQAQVNAAFERALLHHVHHSPHHWQHWVIEDDDCVLRVLSMPEVFVREMVADWMAAGRVKTGGWEVAQWYQAHRAKIRVASDTRALIERLIEAQGVHNYPCGSLGTL